MPVDVEAYAHDRDVRLSRCSKTAPRTTSSLRPPCNGSRLCSYRPQPVLRLLEIRLDPSSSITVSSMTPGITRT